jgi:hypothetical protein
MLMRSIITQLEEYIAHVKTQVENDMVNIHSFSFLIILKILHEDYLSFIYTLCEVIAPGKYCF